MCDDLTTRKKNRHIWITNRTGDIDMFAFKTGKYHNGPRCKICNYGFCEHCFPKGWNTKCGAGGPTFDDSKLDSALVVLGEVIENVVKDGFQHEK